MHWVNLTELMPEHNQTVLLHFEDGEIGTGYCMIYDGKLIEIIHGGIVCKHKSATHWMRLPTPPIQ